MVYALVCRERVLTFRRDQCELCQHPYLLKKSGWTRALDSDVFILLVTALFVAFLLLTGIYGYSFAHTKLSYAQISTPKSFCLT